MKDIMDASFDEIRDYVHAELTDEQILRVLKDYEDEYNELIKDKDHDSWDIGFLRDEIVETLEAEVEQNNE